MSQERLQAHFDKEPIEYIGRGNQVKVYGTSRAVIKVDVPLPNLPALVGQFYRTTLPQVKAGMGGLVLPFEIPARIDAHEIHTSSQWLFFTKREQVPVAFVHPVVQDRVDDSDRLRKHMERASSVSETSHYGDLLLAWMKLAVHRGFLPFEINPSNFVVCHGEILLRDLGGIMGKHIGRRAIMRDKSAMERLGGMYGANYAPLFRDPGIASAFRSRLTRILVDAHKNIRHEPSEVYPVPDLSL